MGDAAPPPRYDRDALRRLLATRTFRRGEFTLASGKRSRVYFNLKATMMHPEGAAHCALGLLETLDGIEADYVAGLEMGAVPLLGAVAALGWERGRTIGAAFVRKASKGYGAALTIEGLDDAGGETLAGRRVVLIDDVATTGMSVLKAADQLAAVGATMADAIVILDREEGAAAALAERGIRLHALFTATDLGVTAEDRLPPD